MLGGAKPRFLASVRNLEEAQLAAALGAELIDLKEPSQGALGAVDRSEQCRIMAALNQRSQPRPPVSATVGDLPFEPTILDAAIRRTAETGVDIVKFGVYASGETARRGFEELDQRLATAPPKTTLVALLLADHVESFDEILGLVDAALRVRGIRGVMLDTALKGEQARPLPEIFNKVELGRFVAAVHERGGFAGLAGCLGIEHIAPLVASGADILGFRGALCWGSRNDALDALSFVQIFDQLKTARASVSSAPLAA